LVGELPNVGMCGGCTTPLELARGDAPDERGRAVGRALAVVSAAQLVLQLDFSIVNIALPAVQRHLHFAPADLQWIVTGYALTFGSLLLLGGRLGDLVGRRRLLLVGLACFGLTSLTAGLAQSAFMLVASRLAQGASAALVAPMALATVTDLYPEGPRRARALGVYQGATAAGASAGIVLGGYSPNTWGGGRSSWSIHRSSQYCSRSSPASFPPHQPEPKPAPSMSPERRL
jgi:MFS family permease